MRKRGREMDTITATKCGACPSWKKQDELQPEGGLCKRMPIGNTFMMMFADDNCLAPQRSELGNNVTGYRKIAETVGVMGGEEE